MSKQDKKDKIISTKDILAATTFTAAAAAVPTVIEKLVPAKSSDKAADVDTSDTDIVVIGSGLAGIFAAIRAADNGMKVTLVDKGSVGLSGMTPWAAASTVIDKEKIDLEQWHHSISKKGEYLAKLEWFDLYVEKSQEVWQEFKSWGATDCECYARGKYFQQQLDKRNINVIERTMVTSLIQDKNKRVAGVVGFTFDDSDEPCKTITVKAKAVISCAGTGAYKSPGFPMRGQTFDSDGLAYRVGASISGKEFTDNHATGTKYPALSYVNFLAETLHNTDMRVLSGTPEGHPGGPIDLAIKTANDGLGGPVEGPPGAAPGSVPGAPPGEGPPGGPKGKGKPGGPPMHEAIRKHTFSERFGAWAFGSSKPKLTPGPGRPDMEGTMIPGATTGMAHHKGEGIYSSDGISGKADGVEGLFAAGDALASYMTGAVYNLGGGSMLGSGIMGNQVGQSAAAYVKNTPVPQYDEALISKLEKETLAPLDREQGYSPTWLLQILQNTMSPYFVTHAKEESRLEGALATIEYVRRNCVPKVIALNGHELRNAHEVDNMLLNAEMKLRVSLFRTESRGSHYREDHPARNDKEWLCWISAKDSDGEMVLSKHPISKKMEPSATLAYSERYPEPFPGDLEYRVQHQIV